MSEDPQQPAAADFYAGKTINLIVGTDVGGGFSIYGRLMARHLGRFIPGNPTLVMRNMPGAGGSTAAKLSLSRRRQGRHRRSAR